MKNIVLTRIDDRLIHGQVITAWIKRYCITQILIIDDELAASRLMQRIYTAAAPIGVGINIKSVRDAVNFLHEKTAQDEKYLVLVKVPDIIEAMLDNDIEIEKVILGAMGAKKSRKPFNRNVYANSEEVESFQRIIGRGVEVFYQLLPNDKAVAIMNVLR